MSDVRRMAMRRSLVLLLVAGGVAAHSAQAGAEKRDPNPLDKARQAAADIPFSGEVAVKWRDADGLHEKTVQVQGRGGAFVVNGERKAMALGNLRLVYDKGDGWRRLWPSGMSAGDAKDLPDRYAVRPTDVDPADGQPDEHTVAGKPAKRVDIVKGTVRERLDLDAGTGFLLAREQYDGDGHTVEQSIAFTEIKLPDPDVDLPVPPPAPDDEGPAHASRAPSHTPTALGDGYAFYAAYRPAGATQLVYGDGFYDVSLFRQSGRLDSDDLPSGRRTVTRDGHRYTQFSWPGGQGVIWAAGGTVYTLVGDASSDELVELAASVPVHRSSSIAHRLRQACRNLVESFTGGR